jgi:GntR family transcriptional regulator
MAEQPMYRKIAEDLQRQIDSGELAPGARLPTELELRELYDNASRNTVRDAVKSLTNKRLIETQPGRGTFVVKKIDPFVTTLSANPQTGLGGGEGAAYESEAAAQRRTQRSSQPRVEIHAATAVIAAELKVDEGAQVVSRHQQRYVDNDPWSLQTSFYRKSLTDQGASRLMEAFDIPEGTVTYLGQAGIKQDGYRDTISVRLPDTTETAFFGLPIDGRVAVVEIIRTAFDERGEPFRVTVSVFPADRNKFVINVGNVPG